MSEVTTGGPGPCPECEGAGVTTLGPLTFLCCECGGAGRVGGDHEHQTRGSGFRVPEDGEEYDPAVHGPLPPSADGFPIWRSPGG